MSEPVNIPALLEEVERKQAWGMERRHLAVSVDIEKLDELRRVLRAVIAEGYTKCE